MSDICDEVRLVSQVREKAYGVPTLAACIESSLSAFAGTVITVSMKGVL